MPPTDIVERAIQAVVAVIDSNNDISAITEKASDNVIAWNADLDAEPPVIAYRAVVATVTGSPGDTREIIFNFTAVAEAESMANELLAVLDSRILWAPALAALSPPLDGYMTNPVRRGIPWDSDEDFYRADLELTLVCTA